MAAETAAATAEATAEAKGTPKRPAASEIPAPAPGPDAETYESTHVHSVYEAIAPHFSSTRHKPWPRVSSFLDSLAPGAVGLDVGCGNGKYLPVNRDLWLLGSDRSANLVALARDNEGVPLGLERKGGGGSSNSSNQARKGAKNQKGSRGQEQGQRQGQSPMETQKQQQDVPPIIPTPTPTAAAAATATATAKHGKNEVLVADTLCLPYRSSSADFAISIAVLHHLSTRERRRLAVRAILDCLRPGSASSTGEDKDDDGDGDAGGKALLFVWALEQRSSRRGWDEGAAQDQLVPWVTKAGTKAAASTSEKRGQEKQPDGPDDQKDGGGGDDEAAARDEDATWHRYYHLYREGELEEDVRAVGGVVLDSGYERDNWWAICSRAPGEKKK